MLNNVNVIAEQQTQLEHTKILSLCNHEFVKGFTSTNILMHVLVFPPQAHLPISVHTTAYSASHIKWNKYI
jgi:hypothetical protein